MGSNIPLTICPYCGYHMDAATHSQQTKAEPEPGDLSVRMGCTGVLVFTDSLELRVIADAEWKELPEELKKEITRGIQAVKTVKRMGYRTS